MREFISGLISGIFTGLGMGGGAVLVMILTIFFKIDQKIAQATNLIFFVPTSIVSIIYNLKNKNIDMKNDVLIIIFGVIGSIMGSTIAIKLNIEILKKIFAVFLMAMAVYYVVVLFIKKKN